MRRDNIFWGVTLILFGFLFLLQMQGIIGNVFEFFWPIILILVGSWIVLGVFWKPAPGSIESFQIPLGAAKSVRYKFSHGAAQIHISGGAPVGQALVGSAAVGMNRHSHLDGDRLEVRVESGPSHIPFIGPADGAWRYQITQEVPVTLSIEAGASAFHVDLKDVLASEIELKTGASSVTMTLPARGISRLNIEGGAANFDLRVPEGVPARIVTLEGFNALNVDQSRFPEINSGIHQSPDFDTALNRTEINVKAAMGSVTVK